MMNITRFALSTALLLSSAAYISADTEVTTTSTCAHGCDHSSVSTEVVSVADIVKQATQDFSLTEEEAAQLTARLEATDAASADIAVIIAEIRTENTCTEDAEVTTQVETAATTELI